MRESESSSGGDALPEPSPVARRAALFRAEDAAPALLRQRSGDEGFVSFVEGMGERAEVLASDPARLIAFLQTSALEIRESPPLATAAGIFMGNSIARLKAEARWQLHDGRPATVGNRRIQFEPAAAIDRLLEGDPRDGRELVAVVGRWADAPDTCAESFDTPQRPVQLAEGQAAYRQPPVPETEFRDDDGSVIPYGDGWGDSGPPDESYGAMSHLERFAPLHPVADALVDYLVSEYDVTASDDIAHSADLLIPHGDVVRAIRLTPADPNAARLTVVYTGYPGVIVHAGVLHDFAYPSCGCDACDDAADSESERLETTVLSVVAGDMWRSFTTAR